MDAGWIASKETGYDLMADMQKRFAACVSMRQAFARDPLARRLLA